MSIREEVGTIVDVRTAGSNRDLIVHARMAPELRIDQSVAHNGVCLTVVELLGDRYRVTAVEETLRRSGLGEAGVGDGINLERSMRLGDRLDGHLVQGHVDTTTRCAGASERDGSWWFSFDMPAERHLLVEKGSICLNGVSLTIAELRADAFSVAIIPYTFHHTTFKELRAGRTVNVEFDVVGKYIERMAAARLRS